MPMRTITYIQISQLTIISLIGVTIGLGWVTCALIEAPVQGWTPTVVAALVVGVGIGLLQALTQVQEMTLTFVPKVTAMLFVMMLALPFMIQSLQDFTNNLFLRIENIE